jgi:hypothetical protein
LLASEVLKRWRTPCLDVIFEYKQSKNRKFIPASLHKLSKSPLILKTSFELPLPPEITKSYQTDKPKDTQISRFDKHIYRAKDWVEWTLAKQKGVKNRELPTAAIIKKIKAVAIYILVIHNNHLQFRIIIICNFILPSSENVFSLINVCSLDRT